MMNNFLKKAVQTGTAVCIVVLLAGQWALSTGPMAQLRQQGRTAAESGHVAEFTGYFVADFLLSMAIPLVFGVIGICVMATYMAFERMQKRQAESGVIVKHGEYRP
jgi:hypothetical protein